MVTNFMNAKQYGTEMYLREQAIRYMIPFLNYVVVDASSKLQDSDVAIRMFKKGVSRSLASIYDKFFPLTKRPFEMCDDDISDWEFERRMDNEYKRIPDIRARFKSVIDDLLFNIDQFANPDESADSREKKEKTEAQNWAALNLHGALNAFFTPDAL